eukprot:3681305-Amphidinium_carterae.1
MTRYEQESKDRLSDSGKLDILQRGVTDSQMRHHLLLHPETRCEVYLSHGEHLPGVRTQVAQWICPLSARAKEKQRGQRQGKGGKGKQPNCNGRGKEKGSKDTDAGKGKEKTQMCATTGWNAIKTNDAGLEREEQTAEERAPSQPPWVMNANMCLLC